MKTVNPARSAYACFIFKKTFFHVYQDGRDASSAETLKCKITVKVNCAFNNNNKRLIFDFT